MKLCILLFAILGVATAAALPAAPVHSRTARSLSDDWQDFFALVDTDAILEVVIVYLAEDAEVQALVEYVLSEDFAALVLAVQQIDEYIAFLDYLHNNGLDIYTWINVINDILGLDNLRLSARSLTRVATTRITGGIAGLWADLLAVLPRDELRALFEEKLETSEDFAALVALFTSDEAKTIYATLKANEEYQHIRETLVAAGLDVDAIFDVLKALIGWA